MKKKNEYLCEICAVCCWKLFKRFCFVQMRHCVGRSFDLLAGRNEREYQNDATTVFVFFNLGCLQCDIKTTTTILTSNSNETWLLKWQIRLTLNQVISIQHWRTNRQMIPIKVDILSNVYFFANSTRSLAHKLLTRCQIIMSQRKCSTQSVSIWYPRPNFNAALWVCEFKLNAWSIRMCRRYRVWIKIAVLLRNFYLFDSFLFISFTHVCVRVFVFISTGHCLVKSFWAIQYASITSSTHVMHFTLISVSFSRPPRGRWCLRRLSRKLANTW